MYRGESELRIKDWWWEEGVVVTNEMEDALREAFKYFCKYLGAENVNKDDLENKCLQKK